jgi:hypothetical protein
MHKGGVSMKSKRKSALLLAVLLFVCFFTAQAQTVDVQAASKTYYLVGFGKGGEWPEYTIKLYLKKNSVVIKGNMQKYTSKHSLEYGGSYKKVKFKNKKYKISSNCQIIEREDQDYSYGYNTYLKERGISSTKNCAGIMVQIVVKNGKVTKIIFSA